MNTNPIPNYCRRFASSGQTPTYFARWYCRAHPLLALQIMEEIGSWPSSEPELRALQKVWPS